METCASCLSLSSRRALCATPMALRPRPFQPIRRIHRTVTRLAEDNRKQEEVGGGDAMERGRRLLLEMDEAKRRNDGEGKVVKEQPSVVTEIKASRTERTTEPPPPPTPPTPPSPPSPPAPPNRPNPSLVALQDVSQAQLKQLQGHLALVRAALTSRAHEFGSKAGNEFGKLGGRINEVTGYKEVERLKDEVVKRETEIARLRESARSAKEAYDTAVTSRASSQADVASLLERKHSWTDSDVSHFTSLVRSDHSTTLLVSTTKLALAQAELAVEAAFDALMKSILERYHEEQVWSDKIRSVSTYGSLVVLVANLVVFVGAMVFVEPWKRRRMVEGLEERVRGMMERVEGSLKEEMGVVRGVLGGLSETRGEKVEVGEVAEIPDGPGLPLILDPSPPEQPEPLFSLDPTPLPSPTLIDSSVPPTASQSHLSRAVASIITSLPFLSPITPKDEQDRVVVAVGVGGFIGGVAVAGLGGLVWVRMR